MTIRGDERVAHKRGAFPRRCLVPALRQFADGMYRVFGNLGGKEGEIDRNEIEIDMHEIFEQCERFILRRIGDRNAARIPPSTSS